MIRKRGRPRIDLTGKRFGRWLVLGSCGPDKFGNIFWRCICDCGSEKIIQGGTLRRGVSNGCASCGTKERWENGSFFGVKVGRKPKRQIEERRSRDDELQQSAAGA